MNAKWAFLGWFLIADWDVAFELSWCCYGPKVPKGNKHKREQGQTPVRAWGVCGVCGSTSTMRVTHNPEGTRRTRSGK